MALRAAGEPDRRSGARCPRAPATHLGYSPQMYALRWAVFSVALVSLSCGGGTPQPTALSSTWTAPSILSHVPAESPYVLASLEPVSERIRERMWLSTMSHEGRLREAIELARAADPAALEPWMRAVLAITAELRGKSMTSWWTDLGFAPSGRFVVYGLSVWPVVRIEVANPTRLRSVIERVLAAGGIQPEQGTLGGHRYWIAGNSTRTVVASVLEREVVVALVPTRALQSTLPRVLGMQKPARNLATTSQLSELLGRHHLLGFMIAYLDARNALDIVTSQRPSELDAPLRAATGPIPPACRTDLERLVALVPRMVFGYRKLDEAGFSGVAVIETAPSVVSGLSKLHAVVPELTASTGAQPLMSFGVAINPDELVGWLRGVTRQLRDRPFTCPWLAPMNEAGAKLAGGLATGLPPPLQGLRGFSMVIDHATAEPLNIDGHVILAGERIADTISAFAAQLPWLAGMPLKRDGRPIAIPTEQLGLPIPSAHFAMSSDRLVIATGSTSAQRVTAHLTTPVPRSSPLLMMSFDAPRLQKLLASFGQSDTEVLDSLGNLGFSLDVASEGIAIDVWGSWGDTAAIARPDPGAP
jgi:hypothetical protein